MRDCEIYGCTTTYEHLQHGGRFYALNKAGTIAHTLSGYGERHIREGHPGRSFCEQAPPGEVTKHLPEDARECKTCVRVAAPFHRDSLRRNRDDAWDMAMTLHKRQAPVWNSRSEEHFTVFVELLDEALCARDIWDLYGMFRDDYEKGRV